MINWRKNKRRQHDKKRCNMVCQKALLWQIHDAGILPVEGVVGMDLIYKQDAIDAIRNIRAIKGTFDDEMLLIDKAEAQTALMMLPSASPDLSKEDMRLIKKLRSFHNGSYAVVLDKLITSACNESKRQATASSDCIYRKDAIDAIHEDADWLAAQGSDWQVERMERDKSILMSLPSAQPEIIRCKDCRWKHGSECVRFSDVIPLPDDFCSKAELRGEEE